jgi:hypothetical protein
MTFKKELHKFHQLINELDKIILKNEETLKIYKNESTNTVS